MCVCTRVCPWGVHRCVRGWGKQWPTGSPSGLSTASPWPTCQESPTRRQSGAPAALGTFLHWGRQLSSVTVWKASHCSYRVLFEQGASDFLRSICSAWKRRKEGGEEGRKESVLAKVTITTTLLIWCMIFILPLRTLCRVAYTSALRLRQPKSTSFLLKHTLPRVQSQHSAVVPLSPGCSLSTLPVPPVPNSLPIVLLNTHKDPVGWCH